MPGICWHSRRSTLRELLRVAPLGLLVMGLTDATAQSFLLRQNGLERNLAGIVYQRPLLRGDQQLSVLSGTYEFIGGANLIDNYDMVFSLPIPAIVADGDSLDNSPANVTVGIRKVVHDWTGDSRWWFMNLTAGTYRYHDGSSAPLAVLTNVHEYHKYTPDAWTVAGGYGFLSTADYGGWLFGGALQPKFTVGGFDRGDRRELVIDYQLDVGWHSGAWQALVELFGSFGATGNLQPIDGRFAHTLSLGLELRWEWLRPGIYYYLPLTSAVADQLDGTLVVQVYFTFTQ